LEPSLVLLAGRKTFSKNESGSYRESDHPVLGDVFGMRVVETHENRNLNDLTLRGFWGKPPLTIYNISGKPELPDTKSDGWFETLELKSAESLYTYQDGYYSGDAVASKNRFGNGIAYYLGTRIGREAMKTLTGIVLSDAKIAPLVDVPQGMQLVRRGDIWIVTNHTGGDLTIQIPVKACAIKGASLHNNTLTLPPHGWGIVKLVSLTDEVSSFRSDHKTFVK
jgi:hypothetical protein